MKLLGMLFKMPYMMLKISVLNLATRLLQNYNDTKKVIAEKKQDAA